MEVLRAPEDSPLKGETAWRIGVAGVLGCYGPATCCGSRGGYSRKTKKTERSMKKSKKRKYIITAIIWFVTMIAAKTA